MELEFVASSGQSPDGTNPSVPVQIQLPIPVEAETGDLLVLAEVTYPGVYSDPGSRFTQVWEFNVYPDWGQILWVGVHDGDPTPITITGSGSSSNVYGRKWAVALGVFRPGEFIAGAVEVLPHPDIPGLSSVDAAIGVVWGRASTGGFTSNAWGGEGWTKVVDTGNYAAVDMAVYQGSPPDATGVSPGGNQFPLHFATIGVRLTPLTPIRPRLTRVYPIHN